MSRYPLRGEIYWVKLDPTVGSEINKTRPCLIVSSDVGNQISNRVIVAPITSVIKRVKSFQVEVMLDEKRSKILLNQIRTVDKIRLGKKIDELDGDAMDKVDEALKVTLSF